MVIVCLVLVNMAASWLTLCDTTVTRSDVLHMCYMYYTYVTHPDAGRVDPGESLGRNRGRTPAAFWPHSGLSYNSQDHLARAGLDLGLLPQQSTHRPLGQSDRGHS